DLGLDDRSRFGGGGELYLPDSDEAPLRSFKPAAARGQRRTWRGDVTQAARATMADGVRTGRRQHQGRDPERDLFERCDALCRALTEAGHLLGSECSLDPEWPGRDTPERIEMGPARQDLSEIVGERPQVGAGRHLSLETHLRSRKSQQLQPLEGDPGRN